ncbi:hypothetical protein CLIB1423_36S00276 [[Candida] railenensis]|uniref:Uncharacterized protein n=1 Tax=[Candida] railenensis TaxID=45579 RepID=A0A9P0QVM2_9ASCO|nr:hypothetical protein CLIB1423_36S00276 [[Candida] railenensis]
MDSIPFPSCFHNRVHKSASRFGFFSPFTNDLGEAFVSRLGLYAGWNIYSMKKKMGRKIIWSGTIIVARESLSNGIRRLRKTGVWLSKGEEGGRREQKWEGDRRRDAVLFFFSFL